MKIATNPETGQQVAYVNGHWAPVQKEAKNRNGQRAVYADGSWHVEEGEVTVKGVAQEYGKGVARGASDTALLSSKFLRGMGPLGMLASQGVEALSEPSRSLVAPKAANSAEEFAANAGSLTGAGLAGGVGGVVRNVIAGGAGAAGGELGKEIGGDVGEFLGTLGASVAAPAAAGRVGAAIKNKIAEVAKPRMAAFERAGVSPSAGQVTDIPFLQGLENLASKFPGGAAVMKAFVQNQQKQLGLNARNATTAEEGGRAIQKGVGSFLERTKQKWQQLDEVTESLMPPNRRVALRNTMNKLDEMVQGEGSTQAANKAVTSSFVRNIREGLLEDIRRTNNNVTLSGLRDIRSKIGARLDDALSSDAPKAELKALYQAISEDIRQSVKYTRAERAFNRQNAYWEARMKRIEQALEKVAPKGRAAEDVFNAAMPKNADQATLLRQVMRSLNGDERTVVTNALVNRMGRALANKQDEVGSAFSTETFLTNWNKLSKGAKMQMFADGKQREALDSLAEIASDIRQGSGVFSNLSGTSGSFAAYAVYLSPLIALSTGSLAPLAIAGKSVAGALVGAKMLTSPKVAKWLSTKINPNRPGVVGAHLGRLNEIYQTAEPGLKAELARFIQAVSKAQEQKQ